VTEEESREGEEVEKEEAGLLLPIESLLSAGIHIGTRINTKDMEAFIYRVRPDGLFVLDVQKTDDRIRTAAKFLSSFDPAKIIVVSSRLYGITPVTKFCEAIFAHPVTGRFLPGLFSNPNHSSHIEAEVVVVTDPKADRQAVIEAALVGIPVVALCDTDNDFSKIDFVIPANNKGRRSLATIYWLLARQILREKGEIPPDGDLSTPIDDFETKLVEARTLVE
jgi:small subunit ribosomal protein S2